MKIPKDTREKLYAEIEANIQARAKKKNKTFKLHGKWKKFVKREQGLKIYAVDGTWVRNNLSVVYNHGGHGYCHEFIPLDEIWIETHHYNENKWSKCSCKTNRKKVSKKFFESCILHEIEELDRMKKGENYWQAHQKAIQKEIKTGLLKDPYSDI